MREEVNPEYVHDQILTAASDKLLPHFCFILTLQGNTKLQLGGYLIQRNAQLL